MAPSNFCTYPYLFCRFPIYNRVSIQLKGGVINQVRHDTCEVERKLCYSHWSYSHSISCTNLSLICSPHSLDQDDSCNLERDLYSRFYYESQVQSFHLVRSLGALAEWYGRIGSVDKAFKYFDTMTRLYMPNEHAPLIYEHYSVNRCAITYAVSALWYLQKGQPKQAIQRCDQVINEILPSYDTKDLVGLYHIIWPIIRVLKWNGEVEKAREFYAKWAPDGIENHFSVGPLHKPMCLLLKICDGNPDGDYETDDMGEDIDMILEFEAPDMTDLNFITDG